MGKEERRKYPRVRIYDPISYLCLNSNGEIFDENTAVVRNVSQTGIQIETFLVIGSEYITLIFFDLDQNQIEIRGEVIYCEKNDLGQYNIGINFAGKAGENLQFVKTLVKSYHYQKAKTFMFISPDILD